jgi:hypothetical protein
MKSIYKLLCDDECTILSKTVVKPINTQIKSDKTNSEKKFGKLSLKEMTGAQYGQ